MIGQFRRGQAQGPAHNKLKIIVSSALLSHES